MLRLNELNSFNNEKYRTARNDPRIMRWCRQRFLISDKDQENWFEKQRKDPTIQMFEINTETGFTGVCGLTSIDNVNRTAEFSIYITPDNQGKGYGKKTLQELVMLGFTEFNLNMIWGETVGENPAMKMFEAVGFKRTGFRPKFYYKNGEYHDSHIFCIEREDWAGELSNGS